MYREHNIKADRSSGGRRRHHLPLPGHHSSIRLRPRPESPAGQFTLHAAAFCEGRVDVLFPPPPWATRSCHVYTHFVALVTNTSTNHLQTVYHDAFCVLRSGFSVYIQHCYSSYTSPGQCLLTISEKWRLQYSTCNFLVLVSVRSRCLDSTPGTEFLGSLEALL